MEKQEERPLLHEGSFFNTYYAHAPLTCNLKSSKECALIEKYASCALINQTLRYTNSLLLSLLHYEVHKLVTAA